MAQYFVSDISQLKTGDSTWQVCSFLINKIVQLKAMDVTM
jgi:hypothetical protein